MHTFAAQCLSTGKPGSLGGAVVADAHVEHAFTYDNTYQIIGHLGLARVREELAAAAAQTMLHPDFQPVHGWIGAHSAFAFAFFQGGDHERARPHFAALGNYADSHPWDVMDDRWRVAFRHARRAVRK